MMKNPLMSLLILTFGLTHYSCKKTTVEPSTPTNQITNPSFEVDSNPSFVGWSRSDTSSVIQFSRDVPPGGGSWSISIETVWAPVARVQTTLKPSEGTHRYSLSAWSKRQGVGGAVYLFLNNALRKSIAIADSAWKVYSIIDTISAAPGDSIIVTLAGGFSQLLTGKTYYDLCTFQKLD